MIDHPAALTWSGVVARRMARHLLAGPLAGPFAGPFAGSAWVAAGDTGTSAGPHA